MRRNRQTYTGEAFFVWSANFQGKVGNKNNFRRIFRMNGLKKYFEFDRLGTNFKTESLAGVTTFLAMAYILFVNPSVLAVAGMPQDAVFTATALAAALATLIMGFYAKLPIALAPGMGLNAFFAYTVCGAMGIPWQNALAGVFVSGILMLIISVSGLREMIINAIPTPLKQAVGAGIGLFICLIGLKNAGIIVPNETTIMALGDFSDPKILLALFGLVITVLMLVRNIYAAVFFGMIITSIVGMIFGIIRTPTGIVGAVPSLEPIFGAVFGSFTDVFTPSMLAVVFTYLFMDFFDTAGTLMAVTSQAGLVKEDGKIPNVEKALVADSTATVVGSVLGTSSTTSFVESTAGVAVGGKTGFTAVVAAILFLLSLFFSPLLSVVTEAVTAPALIVVGILMCKSLAGMEWNRIEIAAPVFFTMVMMPFTYSIATGIALGFIIYPISMLLSKKGEKVHPIMWVLAVIFLLYFLFLA